MIWDVYLGNQFSDPDFFPSRIPDPGQKSIGSRIRNMVNKEIIMVGSSLIVIFEVSYKKTK
jgi:hypothetical protein